MYKRIVLAAVLAIAGSSLLVTSAFARSAATQKGGTLRVNQSDSDFEYVDPQKCYDTGCAEVIWPTSWNLIQYPEKNGPEGKRVYPEAATGFPVVSKDGKTYTFTIRKGHKASNGKVVTAQWFLHAWERVLSPKMGDAASARFGAISNFAAVQGAQAFYDGKANTISGITAKGNTLTIKLTKPFPALITGLTMNWFTATDPATPYSENDANTVVGAGPYYISAREVGRSLVLDRNKYYTGSRPANADRIVITVNVDENQSLLQVKSGQADYDIVGVPAAAAASLGQQYGINKSRFFVEPTSTTSYWGLNSSSASPLVNVKYRQAINWAIDRPAMVRVSGKYAGRRTDQILPPSMPGFQLNNNLYAYKGANPNQAKKVAGDVSSVPALKILTRTAASSILRGQLLRYELEQVGFKATTEAVPTSQLFDRAGSRQGNYDLTALGWQADYPDPRNFINVLLDGRQIPAQGASNNVALFNSPKFNALMDKADALAGAPRLAAYGKLDIQIMKEGAPWAPYINGNNRIFISSRISNFTYNVANTYVALNSLVIK
jgi:ABC-type oligopeptide transport system substrate-binding subunit